MSDQKPCALYADRKKVQSNFVNTKTQGAIESVRIDGMSVLSGLHLERIYRFLKQTVCYNCLSVCLSAGVHKATGSPGVVYVNNMNKMGSIGARLRVDDIRLRRNLKLCNISDKYIFSIISLCIDLVYFPLEMVLSNLTLLRAATFKSPFIELKH